MRKHGKEQYWKERVLPGRPKNRVHFVLRPITLEILNRSLLNLAEITVFSFWTSLSWFIWINLGK